MTYSKYLEVSVNWQFELLGSICCENINSCIDVSTVPIVSKEIENTWSPEHLLIAAEASSFMTAFLSNANRSQLSFIDYDSKATGKIEKIKNKFRVSEITIVPVITVANELLIEKTKKVIEEAARDSLIGSSLKVKIVINPQITYLKEELNPENILL